MGAPTKEIGQARALDHEAIEAEIERVQKLKPDEVRALWRETFKREVPKALTRDLLARTICWHIQEKAFGGHSPAILKLLASYAKGRPAESDRLRRLKPGTELVREYQGERHAVVITAEGYRWRDAYYPSLSAVARAITGSNWNGPRFFGLREAKEGPVKPSAAPPDSPRPPLKPSEGSQTVLAGSESIGAQTNPAGRPATRGASEAKVKSPRKTKGAHRG
ncbi:MAG TPA: DUF2924 domain-containing protein [Rhizomicrobium sp.]|nr:DUF2924 domain-containing protein [Rhizomicrobium sp.]